MSSEPYLDWKGWAVEQFGTCSAAERAYFATELRASGFAVLTGVRILEIGFGNGAFASWAKANGARFTGVESSVELVRRAREKGFEVYETGWLSAQAESFDLVVAFDVFEHVRIPEAEALWRSLHRALLPGGRVIARVPSGDSPFARAAQYGDLTHQTVWGSSAVRQLAARTGFDVVAVRSPAFPLAGLGAASFVRRFLVSAARAMIYPLVTRALMGGGSPVLSPAMLIVLRK